MNEGAWNVPFWGPPARLTKVWSHSATAHRFIHYFAIGAPVNFCKCTNRKWWFTIYAAGYLTSRPTADIEPSRMCNSPREEYTSNSVHCISHMNISQIWICHLFTFFLHHSWPWCTIKLSYCNLGLVDQNSRNQGWYARICIKFYHVLLPCLHNMNCKFRSC